MLRRKIPIITVNTGCGRKIEHLVESFGRGFYDQDGNIIEYW